MEGDSLTLRRPTEIQRSHEIEWRFGLSRTRINKTAEDNILPIFRNRVQIERQTGDLTITNITNEHTEVYELSDDVGNMVFKFIVTIYGEYYRCKQYLILYLHNTPVTYCQLQIIIEFLNFLLSSSCACSCHHQIFFSVFIIIIIIIIIRVQKSAAVFSLECGSCDSLLAQRKQFIVQHQCD